MSENNDELVFDWNVKGDRLEEKFNPKEQKLLRKDYDVNDYKFEYIDYIFQMHSVVNTCVFDKLHEQKEFSEDLDKFFPAILKLDTHVLKAVQCLKLLSIAIYEFEIDISELRSYKTELESKVLAKELWQEFRHWYKTLPQVRYRHYIRMSLGKAKKKFKHSGKWNIIDLWFKEIRESIQRKANMIIDRTLSIFRLNLWEAFNACEENGYNQMYSTELKKQISQLSYNSIYAIAMLRTLVSGYIKIKKIGCVAICFVDDEKKYYSLSGTMEYMGSCTKIKKNRQKFDSTIAKLSPSKDFTHADLTDNVKYYGHKINVDNNTPYFSTPKEVVNADNDPDFENGDVSCCERKIMAAEPNGKKYEFYIRYDPCDFCRPALLPKDNDITFMTSEGDFKPLTKLKVVQNKNSGDLPWYTFVDA